MLVVSQEEPLRRVIVFPITAVISCLLMLGAASLFSKELDLVLQQQREAARRKACAASRLAVNDANMNNLPVPGSNYHFTQLIVDPPRPAGASEPASARRERMSEQLEGQIAEAEENIRRWESQLRSIEMDCAPYAIPDKEGYIQSKSEELERWIEGERLFIHLTKERLAGL